MEIKVQHGSLEAIEADVIIVNLFEGTDVPAGGTGAVDEALNGAITDVIRSGDTRGKLNELSVLYSRGALPAKRVIVVGLGKVADFNLDRVRQAAAWSARRARDLGCKSIATVAHGAGTGQIDAASAAQAVVEGVLLGLYEWREHRNAPRERGPVESLTLVEVDESKLAAVEAGVRAGEGIALGVNRARDLVNEPPNYLLPENLAQAALKMAEETGVKCVVHDIAWMRLQKMGALLGVTQGSANPPQFIELDYQGAEGAPLIFVGKGITFDSGGISLKPAEGMEAMKNDMGGAAAVIGAVEAVARLKLPVHVMGLIPTCENLPSGTAYRPADVLTARNGKTIEIISTDAEGRLILADALCYAADFKPQAVIDLATLTGACVIALGENIAAGFFCNDDDLARRIKIASNATNEKLWRLPLYDEYRDKIRSDNADMKNTGGRFGGVGTSSVFLEEFTSYPWAHWDIAGMATDNTGYTPLTPRVRRPYVIRGGTGFGVRALVELARNWKAS
jgi:leucyl aminopeptidase